jgi:hypothetical protein
MKQLSKAIIMEIRFYHWLERKKGEILHHYRGKNFLKSREIFASLNPLAQMTLQELVKEELESTTVYTKRLRSYAKNRNISLDAAICELNRMNEKEFIEVYYA